VNEIEDREIANLIADLLRASDYIIEARHQLKADTTPEAFAGERLAAYCGLVQPGSFCHPSTVLISA
jgi:hypothetical protein